MDCRREGAGRPLSGRGGEVNPRAAEPCLEAEGR